MCESELSVTFKRYSDNDPSFDLPDEVFDEGEARPQKEKKNKKRKAQTVLISSTLRTRETR